MSATSPNDAARAAPLTGAPIVAAFLALPRKPEEKKIERKEQPAEELPQAGAPPSSLPSVVPAITSPAKKRKAEDIERKEPPTKWPRDATPPTHDADANDDVQFISESTPHRLSSNIAIASDADDGDCQIVKVVQKPLQQQAMSTDSTPALEPSVIHIACETCRANEQQIRYLEAEKEAMRANPRRHSWWYKDELRRICRKLHLLELTSFGKEYLIGRLLGYLDEHNGHVDGKGSPVPTQSTTGQQNVESGAAEVKSSAAEEEPIRTTHQVQHTPRKGVGKSTSQPQTPAAPAPPILLRAVQAQQVVQLDEKRARLSPTRATQAALPLPQRRHSQEKARSRPQVQRQNLRTLIPGPPHRVQKPPRGEVGNESSQSYGQSRLHTSTKPHHGVREVQQVDAMWPGLSALAQPAIPASPPLQEFDASGQQDRAVQRQQQRFQTQGQDRQREMSALDENMQHFAHVYQQQRTPQPQAQPQPQSQVQPQINCPRQHFQEYKFSEQRATATSAQDTAIQQFAPISRVDSLFEPSLDPHQQQVQAHQHHGQRDMTGQIEGTQPFNAWNQQYTAPAPHLQQQSQLSQEPQQYGPMHFPTYDNGMPQFDALYQQHSDPQPHSQYQPQHQQYYQYGGQSQYMVPGAFMQQYEYPSQQNGFEQPRHAPQQRRVQSNGNWNQDDTVLGYHLPLEPDPDFSALFRELFNRPSWQGDGEP